MKIEKHWGHGSLTVKQLIEELEKIQDKDMEVRYDSGFGCINSVEIQEHIEQYESGEDVKLVWVELD